MISSYMDQLLKAGRVKSKIGDRHNRGKEIAHQMLLQGWDQLVLWTSDDFTTGLVPSQRNRSEYYRINLIHCTCECGGSSQGGKYNHHTESFIPEWHN